MERVREKDTGWNRIARMLRQLAKSKAYVKVGFVGERAEAEHDKGGHVSNLELAMIHEYGAPGANIPARPFLGPAIDKNREKYTRQLAIGMAKAMAGSTDAEKVLGLIGAEAAADVKAYVTEGPHIPPPLKPETVKAKGSDRPLVDTGRMIGAVTWEVSGGSE